MWVVWAIELTPLVLYVFIDSQHLYIHWLIHSVKYWMPAVTKRFFWYPNINHLVISYRKSALHSSLKSPLMDRKLNHPHRCTSVERFEVGEEKEYLLNRPKISCFSFKMPGSMQSFILHNTLNFLEKFPEIRQRIRSEWTCANLLEEHLTVLPDKS